MHIKDDFGAGPISQVPASWFNSVAKFINGLIPGDGIVFNKKCDGSPTAISLGDKTDQDPTTYTLVESRSSDDPLNQDIYVRTISVDTHGRVTVGDFAYAFTCPAAIF